MCRFAYRGLSGCALAAELLSRETETGLRAYLLWSVRSLNSQVKRMLDLQIAIEESRLVDYLKLLKKTTRQVVGFFCTVSLSTPLY